MTCQQHEDRYRITRGSRSKITNFLPWLLEISPPVSSPVTEAAVAELEGSLSSEVTERLTDAAGLRSNKLTLRLKLANSPIYRRTMTNRYHLLVHLFGSRHVIFFCNSVITLLFYQIEP